MQVVLILRSIVRYADDFVMGFEKAAAARRMQVDLQDRLAKFGLALHEVIIVYARSNNKKGCNQDQLVRVSMVLNTCEY